MRFSSSLTRWALAAAAVAAVAVLAAWAATGGGMLSPGRLHAGRDGGMPIGGVASHAELSRQCAMCHAPPLGRERMADRCAACHVEIRAELGDTTQLHGILPNGEACLQCHVEHRGPTAVLTDFSGEGFAHERLGFSLAAHQELAAGGPFVCSSCHVEQTFRFAEATCAQCHGAYQAAFTAAHVADWGRACTACHDGVDRFSAFDHQVVGFRLTGSHVQAPCTGCHVEVRALAAFTNAPETCIGCHRPDDPHRGQYGSDCAACHNTGDWNDAEFDHTFPLDHGGEGVIECRTCHQQMPGFRTYTCYSCHDQREMVAEHLDQGIPSIRNCASCHPTGREREADAFRRGDDRGEDDRGRGRGRGRGGRGA
ncbi:MAG TPA: hypothetical protein VHG93_21470 [Longimicrobium sp.]|nr:hypothetical protein [Longimicrobium sp.]